MRLCLVIVLPVRYWRFRKRWYCTIRYDTVYLRALKSWRDGQPNIAHGTETSSSEETVRAMVREGSHKSYPRIVLLRQSGRKKWNYGGIEFVKQVDFKPGVKDRSYGWAEWRIKRRRSDGWRNRWVGNGGTSARIRLTKR